jgi:hypothetical protein
MVRRIGVLLSTREGDPQRQAQLAAFVQRLMELGWTDGRNARLDIRWIDRLRISVYAASPPARSEKDVKPTVSVS